MADGTIEIDLEVDGSKATGQAKSAAAAAGSAASNALSSALSGAGSALSWIGEKAWAGFKAVSAAAAAGGAAIVKSAMDGYASYEQNVGGIQKLFGDAWGTVLQGAQNAWRTSQQSANSYMEQVTSFSASLISSLGGDTAKAAQYADRAITDMSDNANTFGTNIRDIQNAYQGFAKQNYTINFQGRAA